LSRLPITFEENHGQTDPRVRYLARCGGYTAFFSQFGVVFAARRHAGRSIADLLRGPEVGLPEREQLVFRLAFPGANDTPVIETGTPLLGKSNYFIGKRSAKWLANIPNYSQIRYKDLYPAIDLIFMASAHRLKYNFVVAPGADLGAIRLSTLGATAAVDHRGDLVVRESGAELRHLKPLAFQNTAVGRREVRVNYKLDGRQIRFEAANFDSASELIIDPVISFSTLIGGSGNDQGQGGDIHGALAVDPTGQTYITGYTASVDFPVLAAVQSEKHGGGDDAFVMKLDASGGSILFSTFLGGGNDDQGNGITVDVAGDVYVSGRTLSDDFPVTAGVLQGELSNECCNVVVAKLAGSGSTLLYSTYLGGNIGEEGHGIAIDGDGNAYVTAQTASTDFPTTDGAVQRQFGGGVYDITVSKLDPLASTLIYSTYLGGSGTDNIAYNSIGLNSSGEVYLAGRTSSPDFPLVNAIQPQYAGGIFDAWLAKLNATGSALVYSTYFGGSGDDRALESRSMNGGIISPSGTPVRRICPYEMHSSPNSAAALRTALS
jgi:hypothetical protein